MDYVNEYEIDNYEGYNFEKFDTDTIDNFLYHNSDIIYELYTELSTRFSLSTPAFLCKLQSHDLIYFIMDIIQKGLRKTHPNDITRYFGHYYKEELSISFNITNNFLKNTYRRGLLFEQWLYFCYTMSEHYELGL